MTDNYEKNGTQDFYYKVVRMRNNGKIFVYPEEFLTVSDAVDQMIRSATGKYYGKCMAYVFEVTGKECKRIRVFGIDGKYGLDSTAFTGQDSDYHNQRKYIGLMTKYFLILSDTREDSIIRAKVFLEEVITPFLKESGLDKSRLSV